MSFNCPHIRALSAIRFTRVVLILLIFGILSTPVSADKPGPSATRKTPISETEPQLIIDMKHRKIAVKLAGVTLREYAFAVMGDSSTAEKTIGDRSDMPTDRQLIQSVHLISAAERISKSEVKAIAEETSLGTDEIQRYIPKRMILTTTSGQRIYIETDVRNAKTFMWEQIKDVFRRIWYVFADGDSLRIFLNAEDSVSLYGIARNGPMVTVRY